jgi:hypothetical protein
MLSRERNSHSGDDFSRKKLSGNHPSHSRESNVAQREIPGQFMRLVFPGRAADCIILTRARNGLLL